MATATLPPPVLNDSQRADLHRKVCDPLERLRGYIRLYVTLEGAAVLLLYLALWFWIGLFLDFGFFKAFTVDWVELLADARGMRVAVLVVLLSGLVAVVTVKVVLRLLREFRTSALALVLERRFPHLLGDRLITAVELADPQKGEQYGYSRAMIDQTIQEAAERVEQIPVKEAFNWKRLQRYGWLVAGLTFGLYVFVGICYLVYGLAAGTSTRVPDFVQHFHNVAIIWFERNIQLKDTLWPRQAHLELLDFPDSGNLKVGKNVEAVPLRVRAVKWVIADRKARGGWRALTWYDLETQRELVGQVPALPAGWGSSWDPQRQTYVHPTVDAIEQRLDRESGQLPAETVIALRNTLADLTARAQQIAMHRRLRQLEVPESVVITYDGTKTSGEVPLSPDANNEFGGNLVGLKESVRFRAIARDFRTFPQRITLVPPPALTELYQVRAEPAYLYYRAPLGGQLSDLKGQKQLFPQERVYLGDENTVISVPAGTDLRLIGIVDKEREAGQENAKLLASVKILPRRDRTKAPAAAFNQPIVLAPDGKRFEVVFPNVGERLDFDFHFVDTDNVEGRRHVIIEAKMDTAPEVEVFVDVIRRTNQGYMITPVAMVPFSGPATEQGQDKFHGRIRDDHGLDQVHYYFTYNRIEAPSVQRGRAALAALALHLVNAQPPAMLVGAGPYLGYVGHLVEPTAAEPERVERVPLATFTEEVRKRDRFDLTKQQLLARLHKPLEQLPDRMRGPLLPEFTLDADREFFDVQRHLPQLKVSGDTALQPRYRLRLWVAAADNNIEHKDGPRTGESKERFSLIVVSETELLADIAKEEEGLHLKLDQLLARLKDARNKLQQVTQLLIEAEGMNLPQADKDKVYSAQATRALEIADVIAASSITAREVFTDYRRIVREEKVNRVTPAMIEKVENIARLLDLALRDEFVKAEEAERTFQQSLEKKQHNSKLSDEARDQLDRLINRIQEVIDLMGKLKGINDLIVTLRAIEEEQRDNLTLLKYLKQRIEDDLLKDLLDPKKP